MVLSEVRLFLFKSKDSVLSTNFPQNFTKTDILLEPKWVSGTCATSKGESSNTVRQSGKTLRLLLSFKSRCIFSLDTLIHPNKTYVFKRKWRANCFCVILISVLLIAFPFYFFQKVKLTSWDRYYQLLWDCFLLSAAWLEITHSSGHRC